MLNDWWPWTASGREVRDVRGELVCVTPSPEYAKLIAQSPEMLRKLKEVQEEQTEPSIECECGAEHDLNSEVDVDLVVGRAEGSLS